MAQNPLILTLDAGGTNFTFSAIQNSRVTGHSFSLPSNAHDLDLCLQSLKKGFTQLIESIDQHPDAISFAFPGPADYKHGIIGDAPNLAAFTGGVALGPYLEEQFDLPVFINNDGDLFALGESQSGFLPYVNGLLEKAGNPKRYRNLIGITLGTGFGVGISINGKALVGDNSAAAEGWKIRNKRHSYTSVEDTVSIRSLKRMYAEQIAIDPAKAPEPREIYDIATGKADGLREAAIETWLRFGEVVGDAIANILTLIDGLVVIGGGVSGAYPLFSRSMLDELNGYFTMLNGKKDRRVVQQVYDLENEFRRKQFLENQAKELSVPGSVKKVLYHEEKKSGIGLSRLGTSEAITLGAYHFAVERLR